MNNDSTISRSAIVLAAGKGTRMKSDLPKVMHPAHGRPMVEWVVDAARAAGCAPVVLVVGHGAPLVRGHFAGRPGTEFVVQDPQLGTGHAVDMARPLFERGMLGDEVLVLCGDGPLIRPHTLDVLMDTHRRTGAAATLGRFRHVTKLAGTDGRGTDVSRRGEARPRLVPSSRS